MRSPGYSETSKWVTKLHKIIGLRGGFQGDGGNWGTLLDS